MQKAILEDEQLLKTEQLLHFRLTFAAVSFLPVIAFFALTEADFGLYSVLIAIGVVLFYSACGQVLLKTGKLNTVRKIAIFNGTMLMGDILVVTALVHLTKGIESDLYVLYLLPILLASHTFSKRGIYFTALFISCCYVLLLIWENGNSLSLFNDAAQDNGLARAYLHRLWGRILTRSVLLVIVAFIWGGFCNYISGLAQQVTNRLREQLKDNEQLVTERNELVKQLSAKNEDLLHKNLNLDAKNVELRAVQSQLIHQEKMASLGRLVAGIAHELNNPINFVHGNLPYLRTYFEDLKSFVRTSGILCAEKKEEFEQLKAKIKYDFLVIDLENILADLNEGTERIRQIIKNLRSFSRLDEAELKEASVNEGLESTLKILSQYYGRDKILVDLELGTLPPILCYPGQLNQVWMNLLSNAAEALQGAKNIEQPRVVVTTQAQDEQILITIADNGPGIDELVQSKIFEPFFTTKPVGQGTGLGLSICHAIIERHRGRIWFESGEGGGTIFKVLIPIHAQSLIDEEGIEENAVSGAIY